MDKFEYPQGYELIAGVDEVGRGPLVGAVVTAAVILDPNNPIEGLADSKKLSEKHFVLVDGNRIPPNLGMPAQAVVKGDALVAEISAASILAKVARDQEMMELDKKYPQYAFAKHKGYPTKLHLEKLAEFGVLPEYRRSFAPIKNY